MVIPISKDILQPAPIPKSNILFVNSIEEFEKIELENGQTIIAFDTSKEKQVFYAKERDRYGEYSPVMIFFYENFAQRIRHFEEAEFIKKCEDVGLDKLKIECACKFFLDKMKPYDVWIWVTSEKGKDWTWDYVISLKCKLKKKLFPKVATI
jgi:hypothetical protein